MITAPPGVSRRFCFVGIPAVLLGVVSLPAIAAEPVAAHPNFTGHWRIVPKASDFQNRSAPDDLVHVIDHKDPDLSVHSIRTVGGGTTTADLHYYTDGRVERRMVGTNETTTTARWVGPVLVIRTDVHNNKGENFWGEARWSLSDDRDTLTIVTQVGGPKGNFSIRVVCARETV